MEILASAVHKLSITCKRVSEKTSHRKPSFREGVTAYSDERLN